MLPNPNDDFLHRGIEAAKQGERSRARELLLRAAATGSHDERLWLWLASVAESQQEMIRFLEQAVTLNPDDQRVQLWLAHAKETAPRPRKHWQCPLCACESVVEMDRCPRCHAVVTLKDLDALLTNMGADKGLLTERLEQLESLSGKAVDPSVHLRIGLAYLNLGRHYEGITRLRVASQLKPDDAELRAKVVELIRRQEEARLSLAAAAAAASHPHSRTVLVVDDSPTVLKIVGITLEREGHRVLVASNGLQALAKLDELKPDLILLDITMPSMDGYQLCKVIRANAETRGIPVVMLSGRDGFFDKMRGRLAGATDYITKPFDPGTLLQAIEKHCPLAA